MSLKNKGKWGLFNVSGVDFFLEKGRPFPPLCPLQEPICLCPHKTKGKPKKLPYEEGGIYISDKEPLLKGVEVTDDIWFYGQGSLKLIPERLERTNYVPLIIRNFKLHWKIQDWFAMMKNYVEEHRRPIYIICKDVDLIPLPDYIERV